MQTLVLLQIWTRVRMTISYSDNSSTLSASIGHKNVRIAKIGHKSIASHTIINWNNHDDVCSIQLTTEVSIMTWKKIMVKIFVI